MLNGVGLGCVLVCVWALLTKVFPGALAADETYARLREPFGYWNAVGLMAALGVPPLLWLAARRSGRPAANALAWPALGLLFTCVMLSYSRGSLLALLIGLAYWFAVVPLRLRGLVPLLVAAAASAPVIGWAFARDALSADQCRSPREPMPATSSVRCSLLMALALLAAGLAVGFLTDSRADPAAHPPDRRAARWWRSSSASRSRWSRRSPMAPGGIDGQTSKAWTSSPAVPPARRPTRPTA